MAAPQKISLYNLNDLKTTTDDALAPILTSLPKPYKFTQQHFYTNVRLALGYTAVIIAGALFYIDWKFGWDVTKPYTLPACVAYFVLNSALTYWQWFVEKGKVFVGVREGGQKLTLTSSITKHKPIYTLKIRYEAPQTGTVWINDETIEGNFTEWFNIQGFLERKELKKWLAGKIEVVGLADPESKRAWDQMIEDERVDEEVVSPGAVRSGAEPAVSQGQMGGGSAKKRGKGKNVG